jgi:hypothetical protein
VFLAPNSGKRSGLFVSRRGAETNGPLSLPLVFTPPLVLAPEAQAGGVNGGNFPAQHMAAAEGPRRGRPLVFHVSVRRDRGAQRQRPKVPDGGLRLRALREERPLLSRQRAGPLAKHPSALGRGTPGDAAGPLRLAD